MPIAIGIALAAVFVVGALVGVWTAYRRNRSSEVFDSTNDLLPGALNGRRTPSEAEDGTPTRV